MKAARGEGFVVVLAGSHNSCAGDGCCGLVGAGGDLYQASHPVGKVSYIVYISTHCGYIL